MKSVAQILPTPFDFSLFCTNSVFFFAPVLVMFSCRGTASCLLAIFFALKATHSLVLLPSEPTLVVISQRTTTSSKITKNTRFSCHYRTTTTTDLTYCSGSLTRPTLPDERKRERLYFLPSLRSCCLLPLKLTDSALR